jgi:hypothetical protein
MPIWAARSEWPGVDSSACSCAAARSCVIFSLDFFDEPLNSFFSFSSTAGSYQRRRQARTGAGDGGGSRSWALSWEASSAFSSSSTPGLGPRQ